MYSSVERPLLSASSSTSVSPLPVPMLRSGRCCQPRCWQHGCRAARRQQQVLAAYAPSLPSTSTSRPSSLDPLAATWEQAWEPGRMLTVKSPQQFDELLAEHPDKLVVLMCKSHSCRPCKMFTRKYLSMAQRFPECILAEVYGDETPETRKMMIKMDVRVTPTFRMYREQQVVDVVTGTNEKKVMRGILDHLFPSELVGHAQEIADSMLDDSASTSEAQQSPSVPAPAATGSS